MHKISRLKGATAVGVDIGTRMIKILQLRESASAIEIDEATTLIIPEGWVSCGTVVYPKRMGKLISDALPGLKGLGAFVSIPSNLATLRWVGLPLMEPEELREAVKYKVRRHLPYPVEEAYLEASQPVKDPEASEAQSLVIAVKRPVIDSRAMTLEYAGLKPMGAELEAQALLRVVERDLGGRSVLYRDASMTIIDVGSTNTHMYVVQNRRLQFIRGVRFGSLYIAQAIAEVLDVDVETAQQMLSEPSTSLMSNGTLVITAGSQRAIVNISETLEKLTREFLRLLRYFRSLHPERSYAGILDQAIICGGLSSLRGFSRHIQDSLNLRVERSRPFGGMIANLKHETFESVSRHEESFAVSAGLALSGLSAQFAETVLEEEEQFVWTRSA